MAVCENHKACIDDALRTADAVCRVRGARLTGLRRRVLAAIWENHGPARAYDILDKLASGDVPARPPTVYRALDFLLKHGLAHKLNSLRAYAGCSHPLQHDECYFLICSRCREIRECCNTELASAIAATARQNNFNMERATIEITGQCPECTSALH